MPTFALVHKNRLSAKQESTDQVLIHNVNSPPGGGGQMLCFSRRNVFCPYVNFPQTSQRKLFCDALKALKSTFEPRCGAQRQRAHRPPIRLRRENLSPFANLPPPKPFVSRPRRLRLQETHSLPQICPRPYLLDPPLVHIYVSVCF